MKPNRITKVEVTYIDAAKQVEPDMLLGYALKMKDALRLAHLHKTQCCTFAFLMSIRLSQTALVLIYLFPQSNVVFLFRLHYLLNIDD